VNCGARRRRRTSIIAFNLAVTFDRYTPLPAHFRFACFPQTDRAAASVRSADYKSQRPISLIVLCKRCFFTQNGDCNVDGNREYKTCNGISSSANILINFSANQASLSIAFNYLNRKIALTPNELNSFNRRRERCNINNRNNQRNAICVFLAMFV